MAEEGKLEQIGIQTMWSPIGDHMRELLANRSPTERVELWLEIQDQFDWNSIPRLNRVNGGSPPELHNMLTKWLLFDGWYDHVLSSKRLAADIEAAANSVLLPGRSPAFYAMPAVLCSLICKYSGPTRMKYFDTAEAGKCIAFYPPPCVSEGMGGIFGYGAAAIPPWRWVDEAFVLEWKNKKGIFRETLDRWELWSTPPGS